MEAAIQQKIDTWLNGNFDEDVKSQIKKLQRPIRMNWPMLFTATWNLAQAVCGV
jgi:hypothetical protein